MPAPSATCELYIDGVRVPDTADQYEAGLVVALDGLSLTWGRDGQNEQPGPASCSMDFLDPAGNNDILDVLHVGSNVTVWAEGQIPNPATDFEQIMDDGTFDSYPLGQAYPFTDTSPASRYFSTQSRLLGSVVASGDGGRLLRAEQDPSANYQGTLSVSIPPRRFSPEDQLPDAWDDIPKQRKGEPPWRFSVIFRAPKGIRVRAYRLYYPSPYTTWAWTSGTLASVIATGDWQTITADVAYSLGGSYDEAWPGIQVTTDPTSVLTWQGQTTTWETETRTWAEIPARLLEVDSAFIGYPANLDPTRRVLVFSGEVSDVQVAPAGDGLTTAITATAMDQGAELGNTVVGDNPWPVQTAQVRGNRITQLAGITSSPRIRIDDSIETLQLSYRDVDAQPAFALLQDLAQSIGGVLWVATHALTGPFLWIEDPATRAAVQQLVESGGVITITGATRDVSVVSACDLLEDGVSWRQDTADVITVVAVTWLEQGVDDDGQPATTERTVTVTDTAAVATYGTRRLSISTELVAEADATAMANRILAQARAVAWRLDGLTMDTAVLAGAAEQADPDDDPLSVDDASREIALLDLLDGTIRMGAAVTLVDMPAYAPRGAISSVYVEGGRYTFTGGYWVLQLTTTPSAGQGQSATWEQLDPTWTWQQFSPDIAWVDLYGVTA